jgi:hypothetical protein
MYGRRLPPFSGSALSAIRFICNGFTSTGQEGSPVQTALWQNDTILSIGISHTEPKLLTQLRIPVLQPSITRGQQQVQQALPSAQHGAVATQVTSRTKHGLTIRTTPVKPQPDAPPLVVYIVTVSPIK